MSPDTNSTISRIAAIEKHRVALLSVIAAIVLTGSKAIVGWWTNSLGILSEAAHSGLDLVATIVTLFAVRYSDRPADEDHLYGHGKMENLSAMFQVLLLLVTCVWIIYEGVKRLFVKHAEVDASIWAFGVVLASIAIDYSRSRALSRAARKYSSQALEADALHFSTDIWSSCVVLLGLIGVRLTAVFPAHEAWLAKADAAAALGVAVIVIAVSIRLGRRTLHGLLDTAPAGLTRKIKQAAESLPGVTDCHNIRVRVAGPQVFVDVHILADGEQSLADAHALTEQIEQAIRSVAPGADVTVHPEPQPADKPPEPRRELKGWVD